MAASSSGVVTLVPAGQQPAGEDQDCEMVLFLAEMNQLQKDPEKLSPEDQIARLFRPGCKYFNMNPFEVLGLRHTATREEVNKAYRRMSVQVHPDKNQGNDLAQPAFELVKAAHERLEDEERMAFCQRICAAASDAAEKKAKSAKKKLRKEGKDDSIPEDDPMRMELSIKVMISRMFAEFEQRKKQLEERDKEQRDKAKEQQAEKEFMEALQKREQKMWEKSRQKRVQGWRSWDAQGGGKHPKMPKVKEERRTDGTSGYNAANDEKGEEYKKAWR